MSGFLEKVGWSEDHPNVHITTDEPNLTVFMPEGVEDTHVIRYFDPKGSIHENVIESQTFVPEGVGAEIDVKPYTLTINGTITVPMDPVFETHPDRNVQKYAKDAKFSDDMAVFHNAKKVNIPLEPQGTLELELDNKRMIGKYELPESGSAKMYAQDRMGNKAIITFTGGAIINIDFGVELNERSSLSSTPLAFKCDASDIDHITGLVMALEDKMASGELENMENHFNIINAHREALEKNLDIEPGPKVNASVHAITSALWNQHIEKSLLDRGQDFIQRVKDKKALKNVSDSELVTMLEEQITEAETLRRAGSLATDNVNHASNIASLLRRKKVLASRNPKLVDLYRRLNQLVKTKGTARVSKIKESKDIKKEKKQELEVDRKGRTALRKFERVAPPKFNEEEEQDVPAMAARRYK